MAAKEMNNGEFWLPSDFLDDDFFDMEPEEEERISLPTHTHFKNTPKLATSPQSTLYGLGGRSFSSGGGGSPLPPSPSTAFTTMYEEAMRMEINGLMRKDSVQEKAALIQQQLRTAQFYQLRRQQLMKLQQQQFATAAAAALGRNSKSRSIGAYGAPPPNSANSSAWPQLQKQKQQQNNLNGSGMRTVFLNGSSGKIRESMGTGVFLPRRGAGTQDETRKKSVCSTTIFLPARVVQSLNLNLPTGYVLDHGDALIANLPKRSYHYPQQQPAQAAGHEMRLPQEWTY